MCSIEGEGIDILLLLRSCSRAVWWPQVQSCWTASVLVVVKLRVLSKWIVLRRQCKTLDTDDITTGSTDLITKANAKTTIASLAPLIWSQDERRNGSAFWFQIRCRGHTHQLRHTHTRHLSTHKIRLQLTRISQQLSLIERKVRTLTATPEARTTLQKLRKSLSTQTC